MAKEFLGKGWSIQNQVDKNHGIAMCEGDSDIKESILIILNTAKKERIMRPDFGCGIHNFVFDVINTAKLSLIKYYIQEALAKWEPRIEVQNIITSTAKLAEGVLSIEIKYKIRLTNTIDNLVYPFYLKEGR